MQRADWNLLVLAAAKGRPLSPVQLQKSLFILSKGLGADMLGEGFYEFEPYNYGPFDATVYSDSRMLALQDFAIVASCPQGFFEYSATSAGITNAEILETKLPQQVVDYIHNVVEWVKGQSFSSLVKAIYERYPEMRANSIFKY